MKHLFTIALLFFCLTATAQIHIEAEAEMSAFGVQEIPCSEGANTNKAIQMNAHDWAQYNTTVFADGIYKLSVRASGTAANIWVCDTLWNSLGKVLLKKTGGAEVTDQVYSTYTGTVYIRAANNKIRLQARQVLADYRSASVMIDWIEITATNLIVVNTFDSDWDTYTAGYVPWRAANRDSVFSTWESSPGFYGWIKQTARPESFRLYQNPLADISYGVFELKKSDTTLPPNVRAEIYKSYSPHQTLWIAFSFMSPTDITNDGLPHTYAQFHGVGAISPPISLRVENVAGVPKYVMKVLWSAVLNPTVHAGEITQVLADYVPGQWVRWTIYVKFAYDNTGQLRVYKDGTEIFSRLNLPNCYNDGQYPYFKIGIYKWGWRGGQSVNGQWVLWAELTPYNTLVHYYDNLFIGGPNSSFAEVNQL